MREALSIGLATEEWLAARRLRVQASEVAAVLGADPYRSTWTVWSEKRGLVRGPIESEAMEWGHRLEPLVAQAYASRTGAELRDDGRYAIVVHPSAPLGATLDRRIVAPPPPGVLEIKTSSGRRSEEWDEGRAPLRHQVQIQAQLACTGLERGVLCVLIAGQRLVIREYPRDDRLIAIMLEEVSRFWDLVERGIPPPIDGHPATIAAIKALHPRDSGESIELPAAALPALDEWDAAREDERELRVRRDAAQAALCAAIGDATWARIPGGRLQWRVEERSEKCPHCGGQTRHAASRVLRRIK